MSTEETQQAPSSSDVEVSSTDRQAAPQAVEAKTDKSPESPDKSQEDESSTDEQEASGTSTTDDDDSSEEDSEESSDETPKKSKNGKQRRISKLIKQRAEAEARAKLLEEQLAKVQQQSPQSQDANSQKPAATQDKPNPDDFDTQVDYFEALTDWKVEQRLKAEHKAQQDKALRAEQETQVSAFQARVADFAKAHADFEEAVEDVSDIQMSLTVQQELLNSENGPELMYALAKDREEYARICSLSPLAAAKALGRFEARLSDESPQPKKEIKTTKAPKPVSPVGTKSTGMSAKSLDTADYEDYRRIRMEQMQQNRR